MSADMHSCSYSCQRPACVLAQRDELAKCAEQDAAEIVRLRGEVEFHRLDAGALRVQLDSCIERLEVKTKNALHLYAMMVDAEERATATIAPAEANGNWDCPHSALDGCDCYTPQPAGGEAVAWQEVDEDGEPQWHEASFAEDSSPFDRCRPLYTTPPAAPAQGGEAVARPMDTAPRDGTIIRLLVEFTENATEDTTGAAWTIGHNSLDNTGEDEWQFAGWCWTHDHYTSGEGRPVGWLPLLVTTPPAAQVQQPEEYAEGPTWTHNGQRISLVNGQLLITRNGKIEFIGAAHPSACELGAVREALEAAARSLRTIAEQAGKTEGLDDMMNVRGYANSRANVAELALQHRGGEASGG